MSIQQLKNCGNPVTKEHIAQLDHEAAREVAKELLVLFCSRLRDLEADGAPNVFEIDKMEQLANRDLALYWEDFRKNDVDRPAIRFRVQRTM